VLGDSCPLLDHLHVPIVTEGITAAGDRLAVLFLDQQVEVDGYISTHSFRARSAMYQWQRRIGSVNARRSQAIWASVRVALYVRVDRVRPGQLRHRLGDVDERGPGS
jgi:hypothetical protein